MKRQWSGTDTSCPRHQTGKEHIQFRRHKIKTSQEDSSFPADGQQTILNKWTKSQRQTESGRTLTIRINHNRSTSSERSVINDSGFKPGLRAHNLALESAVVHKHTSYSVRVKDFQHIDTSNQRTYKSRFNTEMKRDEYSTARPTQKRWRNRNPTVESRWARPKTEPWVPLDWKYFRPEPSLNPDPPARN